MNTNKDNYPLEDTSPHIPGKPRNIVILPDGNKPEPLGSGTITGLLGIGGMANVYKIWNSQLEVSRAVKLLHPNYTEEAKQRFQTEIKITAKLHHPNIVEIHAVGEWHGLPYIEMEMVDGYTIDALIAKRGAIPVEVSIAIGIMIGRALNYAHHQEYIIYGNQYHGVIHRDLKPSNVMISNDGRVKLMDFGIAKPTDASIHTTDGAILGTMQYLSPEQLDGKSVDLRTDIYSLGAVLYEMITGVKAFPHQNVSKLMFAKIKNEFTPLERFTIAVQPRLKKLIARCLMHSRDRRIHNTEAFLSELERIYRDMVSQPPELLLRDFTILGDTSKTIVTVKRRPLYQTILTLVALMALCFGTVWLYQQHLHSWFARWRLSPVGEMERPTSLPEKVVVLPAEQIPAAIPTPKPLQKKSELVQSLLSEPVAPPVQPAEVSDVKRVQENETLLDRLSFLYGTDNLEIIFKREVESKHASQALMVYDAMDKNIAQTPTVLLYKLRALKQLKGFAALDDFLNNTKLDDAEMVLTRLARALDRGDITMATRLLGQLDAAPSLLLEQESVRLEAVYDKARISSALFDRNPTSSSRSIAQDCWYQVMLPLRSTPGHQYYQTAESERQRIGKVPLSDEK